MSLRIFFSKDFAKFDASRLEFRKRIVKLLQISISLALVLTMILIFPFRKMDFYFYIILPGYFIFNNIICFILQQKSFEKYCKLYLIIMQVIIPSLVLELSVLASRSQTSEKVLFVGLQAGLFFSICFVSELPSLTTFASSAVYIVHIAVRQYTQAVENSSGAALLMFSVVAIINYINYNKELINFRIWTSMKKSNESLLHFQKLIENFPNQLIVLNRNSLDSDKPVYLNEEASRLRNEFLSNGSESLTNLLNCFLVSQEITSINNENTENAHLFEGEKLLSQHLKNVLNNSASNDILTLQAHFRKKEKLNDEANSKMSDSSKKDEKKEKKATWEIKISWAEWNETEAVIVIFNDISLSNKLRALKKLDKIKDELLASVSHELRTPLNGIIGMIDAADQETPEFQTSIKEYLQIARGSAKTLLFMINDILDISQMRKGTLRLNSESVVINDLIEKVLALIKIQMKEKAIDIIYENFCSKHARAYVDPIRFQQILMNLLWNAYKFTNEGYIKLMVQPKGSEGQAKALISEKSSEFDDLCNESESSGQSPLISISVIDTGIGIPREKIPGLFKLFGKLENPSNRNGVGLGLAISQSLAKKMHPSGIEVKSIFGQGSNFTFHVPSLFSQLNLPYANSTNDNKKFQSFSKKYPMSSMEISYKKAEDLQTFKILIVEDDPVNHLVLEIYLRNLSDRVSADKAHNGLEAVNIIKARAKDELFYDLILLDCDMPIMNGFQAAKAILDLIKNRIIPRVKIVAFTANSTVSDKDTYSNCGIAEIWSKPIAKQEFLTKLAKEMELFK